MRYAPLILVGMFLTLASSLTGLVLMPRAQLGGLQPVQLESGEEYPIEPAGEDRKSVV